MTKKDYIIIATALSQAIQESAGKSGKATARSVIEHISHALSVDNPNFQPSKFEDYIVKLMRD
jgi:hypothetical protein